MLTEPQLKSLFDRELGDDPVFGVLSHATIDTFFDGGKLTRIREQIEKANGMKLVVGTGASVVCPGAPLIAYVDMPRWEIQKRQRAGLLGNLGLSNRTAPASEKYKRAFFLDWRVADRLKVSVAKRVAVFIDTTEPSSPKMLDAQNYFTELLKAIKAPLRLVPFFDPGPWGGQWMKEVFDLPHEAVNYAWCFDCVPEENSLRLRFDDVIYELPAINLVLFFPQQLLGEAVYARFGADFPIRFDLLDTMGGGNLSLQVHPLREYAEQQFGLSYTQDESYYLLDVEAGAKIYLGLKNADDPNAMIRDLELAQRSGETFPTDRYVHSIPAKKHDHFLIPAGTVHCSGSGCMVLEISATPYIFTFKMWDWLRMGLDGLPRPIHLEHAFANIRWNQTQDFVDCELTNVVSVVAEGPGWREERTGLHKEEFIETRRHWFSVPVEHDTRGAVNVLNLVEGSSVLIESPTASFTPFELHYAETVILPAAVGQYRISPCGPEENREFATVKAYVRNTHTGNAKAT
ncbi:class I mannose-6-phosphate isomerase [Tunturiibacter empetritectus]|uniref:Mannose-6-phosphate isomerase class I n=1 Tax=Tunturiibacter lichenicola TaxID=2051959 RepID=A0A852VMB3_9BACT|nr:class I mannose-6-phosphate isomerase [Edaphobacter lichenicola]NYF91544.1 mannose-6-phosphate isomerase class I [Edaphobacter lichenicola]